MAAASLPGLAHPAPGLALLLLLVSCPGCQSITETVSSLRSVVPVFLLPDSYVIKTRWRGNGDVSTAVCNYLQVFLFEKTLLGYLRLTECSQTRYDSCTGEGEPDGEIVVMLDISLCKVQQFRSYMLCLAETLDVCTQLFSFEVAIPYREEGGETEVDAKFDFDMKVKPNDFVDERIEKIEENMNSKHSKEDTTISINVEDDRMETKQSSDNSKVSYNHNDDMKISKYKDDNTQDHTLYDSQNARATNYGRNNVHRQRNDPSDYVYPREGVKTYYLFLPMIILLIAVSCVLCIFSVIFC